LLSIQTYYKLAYYKLEDHEKALELVKEVNLYLDLFGTPVLPKYAAFNFVFSLVEAACMEDMGFEHNEVSSSSPDDCLFIDVMVLKGRWFNAILSREEALSICDICLANDPKNVSAIIEKARFLRTVHYWHKNATLMIEEMELMTEARNLANNCPEVVFEFAFVKYHKLLFNGGNGYVYENIEQCFVDFCQALHDSPNTEQYPVRASQLENCANVLIKMPEIVLLMCSNAVNCIKAVVEMSNTQPGMQLCKTLLFNLQHSIHVGEYSLDFEPLQQLRKTIRAAVVDHTLLNTISLDLIGIEESELGPDLLAKVWATKAYECCGYSSKQMPLSDKFKEHRNKLLHLGTSYQIPENILFPLLRVSFVRNLPEIKMYASMCYELCGNSAMHSAQYARYLLYVAGTANKKRFDKEVWQKGVDVLKKLFATPDVNWQTPAAVYLSEASTLCGNYLLEKEPMTPELLDLTESCFKAVLGILPDVCYSHANMSKLYYLKNMKQEALEELQLAVTSCCESNRELGSANYDFIYAMSDADPQFNPLPVIETMFEYQHILVDIDIIRESIIQQVRRYRETYHF
jgi:tetratricopeptide (TPR) repeat protein